jgi:hypothetical protein
MVKPDFLREPLVRQWLDGVEPAWTLLTMDGLRSLIHERSTIRIADDLSAAETTASAAARNTLILLRKLVERGGLALTETGKLSRAVVAELGELFEWPNFDRALMLEYNKVTNETDYLPLHVVHLLARGAKLVRPRRRKLLATPLARSFLDEPRQGSLQAMLFRTMFWRINLAYFGGSLRSPWPQTHTGVVLWSLSVSAGDWLTSAKLARLCTIPEPEMLMVDKAWPIYSTEARILRPLMWFGLLEHRSEDIPGRPYESLDYYRKSALFDRLLAFDVKMDPAERLRH